jgi:hypothetical protein
MINENTKKQPVFACRDDKVIMKRMKKVGIWTKMHELSKSGETITVLTGPELFIWHGVPGDSGYTYFQSDNPSELLLLACQALGNPSAVKQNTKH